jgi:hypothetical protein
MVTTLITNEKRNYYHDQWLLFSLSSNAVGGEGWGEEGLRKIYLLFKRSNHSNLKNKYYD